MQVRRKDTVELAVKSQEEYKQIGDTMAKSLDNDQLTVFTEIMNAASSLLSDKNCFFIDGPGGSGKLQYFLNFTHSL